ncbi:MAG: tetratricopeptide repeat protein, partial [Pirellulales bacterium]
MKREMMIRIGFHYSLLLICAFWLSVAAADEPVPATTAPFDLADESAEDPAIEDDGLFDDVPLESETDAEAVSPADQLEKELAEAKEQEFPGQEHLDEAMKLKIAVKQLNDLDRVITLCEKAIELGLPEGSIDFAEQLVVASRFERAARLSSEIFERQPPNRNWPRLARLALVDLQKVVKQDDKLAEAHFLIGRIHALPGGDPDKSRASLEKAVEMAGENVGLTADAYAMLGGVVKDADKKLDYLNKAIELSADHVEALRSRGLHYMASNEHEKALADFRRAIQLEPEHAKTHEVLAIDLMMTGKVEEAKNELDKAIELSPDEASAYAHRARIYNARGENEPALADIDRALAIRSNLGWRLLRAQIHQQAGDAAAAMIDVDRVLAVQADLLPAIRMKAMLLVAEDRHDEATVIIRSALKDAPDDLDLKFILASLLRADRKPELAIELFDQIIERQPDSFEVYRARADLLLSMGRQADAAKDYEKALKIQPKDSSILNNLAWLLATSPDEKIRDGKRAVELATSASEVTEHKESFI